MDSIAIECPMDQNPANVEAALSRYFEKNIRWLGTRSRRAKQNNSTPPSLEQIKMVVQNWARTYPGEIERVWFFGSRARNQPESEDSDWDVAVRPMGATVADKDRIGFEWL